MAKMWGTLVRIWISTLSQVLDGRVTDLEVGAFCVAMRIKGETAEEMCGLLDAVHARIAAFPAVSAVSTVSAGAGGQPLIVLPSYNGARRLPVLTPLLALLLAREGLPVLLHGMRTEALRVLASEVLEALDIPALTAPESIAPGSVAHLGTAALLPGLARLLAVREVIGLRTPGHSVAKLLNPCAGPALVVSSYTHPRFGIATEVMGASFRNVGQITALAGCDLLTIAPELLAQLAASEAPLQRALNADAAKAMDLPAVNYDEAGFRYALNEDAMATEKLAEGIRAFAVDAVKLEKLILAL